jgi:predicted nucleotidyltransferase
MTELEVLADAVRRLENAGVDYMVTGSIALSYYAQPRMTRDVDLVVECGGRAAGEIVALFRPDYYVSDEDVTWALRDAAMFNVLHLASVVKLDFIVRKQTPFRAHEFARRQRVALPGFQVWMVGKEDLILSKLAWAKPTRSELQLRDVRALLETGADVDYLRRWAPDLSVSDLLEELLGERHEP